MCIFLDGSDPSKYPPKKQKDRNSLEESVIWDIKVLSYFVISGMSGVAMARNGLILWENGATGSRKVFRYLWGLRDTIKKSKNTAFYRIFLYRLFGVSRWGYVFNLPGQPRC